ncbi:MAG TPA: thioredoxin domain-containing protein [Candidatus Omnitrophota bacterium]|nr:thioredoxin domain-containing protein [Candidatus Omnitrophota bacterium]HPD84930.1 thioredoxin domain-containing protein [Candidatus Omnitrophota bacterium]HRZ03788.1 thioredoxin domain-containing protein [Candidatus Omnitrophota bacterium]
MKISKPAVTALVIVASVVFINAVRLLMDRARRLSPSQVSAARTKGNPRAPIRIVEYIDFQCPGCISGSLLLKEYIEKYPAQIYLELKYYPLSQIHRHALKTAVYSECAARQNNFWPFFYTMLEKRSVWERMINPDSLFIDIAKQLRLNIPKFQSCAENEKTKTDVLNEKAEGRARGVQSTPTYFLNGKMLTGPKPLREELEKFFKGDSL